jgi:hypothetical protein
MRLFSIVLESFDAPSFVSIVLETSKQIWWVLESAQKTATRTTISSTLFGHFSKQVAHVSFSGVLETFDLSSTAGWEAGQIQR